MTVLWFVWAHFLIKQTVAAERVASYAADFSVVPPLSTHKRLLGSDTKNYCVRGYWKGHLYLNARLSYFQLLVQSPAVWLEFACPANQHPNSKIKKKAHKPLRTS